MRDKVLGPRFTFKYNPVKGRKWPDLFERFDIWNRSKRGTWKRWKKEGSCGGQGRRWRGQSFAAERVITRQQLLWQLECLFQLCCKKVVVGLGGGGGTCCVCSILSLSSCVCLSAVNLHACVHKIVEEALWAALASPLSVYSGFVVCVFCALLHKHACCIIGSYLHSVVTKGGNL